MTSLTLAPPVFWDQFVKFRKALTLSRNNIPASDALEEDSRARRGFVLEMLDRDPDAFQGEMDILNMAHPCHRQF